MTGEISLGSAISAAITGHTSPADAVADIQSGKWAAQIAALRSASGDERDRLKKTLPAFLWAGTFTSRKNDGIEKFSGLICADVDKIAERVGELHDIARNDPHVAAAFVSPSGTGIKIVFRVPVATDAKQHQQIFNAVRSHVALIYAAKVDEAAKDVARLCFVSHDPAAFYDAAAVPLEVNGHEVAPKLPEVLPAANVAPSTRTQIAEKILGSIQRTDEGDFCECPGKHLHTTANAAKDCKVMLDGVPTIKCFHASCAGIVDGVNHEFRSQVGRAEFVRPAASGWTPAIKIEPSEPTADATTPRASASPEIIVLPSGGVSISESARVIFQRIAPSRTLFWRGGALVELVTVDGVQSLEVLKPEKFRSDVEKHGKLFVWRVGRNGNPALNSAKMSLDDAKAILAASEAREFLPSVASVLRCPVLIETKSGDVAILGKGYHLDLGGLLIVSGDTPPKVELPEAVKTLLWLVDEFSFQDEGDRSRALSAFLTPALRIGGFIPKPIPFDCAEADTSQAGKGYRHTLNCALYNEASYFVTAKAGGVGSVDESFAAALISGRPFICLDNFRGLMDSQNIEAFLTCPSLFPCRIPHRGEVLIDPRRFILQMSSNGLETTRDLANRASICRIRKRPGFQYRDTLGELQRRQPYFLGCVFAIITEWISIGKPRTSDTRHDFREWSQSLDWIVQNILGCAPLMDGHQAAQERTSNPALSWLRAVALAVAGENRLGVALIASELVEVCEQHAIEIPGKPADEDRAKRQIGSLCKQLFRDSDIVNVDGFNVSRGRKEYRKPSGDLDFTNAYIFTK